MVDGIVPFRLAVKSVFAQTREDWELVIVCDGSPAEIVEAAMAIDDDRVKVIVHHERRGLPVGLNEIAEHAEAEVIIRMDSDDVMLPDRVGRLARHLQENLEVDVLGSASYLVDEGYQVMGAYREPELPSAPAGFLNSGVFSHPTVAFRRSWALSNPYDPERTRTEDKELWMRTCKQSTFSKLDDRLLFCMVPRALSVEKQALTARFDRKLLMEVGPSVAPVKAVVTKVAQSYLKQIVFALAARVGLLRHIHRTKYTRLAGDEQAYAQSVLDRIEHVSVAGWPS